MKKEFVLLAALVALTIVLMKTGGLGITNVWPDIPGMEPDAGVGVSAQYDVPYKLTVLEGLGFSFAEEEREMLSDQEYAASYADLLFFQGMGSFDEETWAWSPTSDKVYALDTEVFDVGRMYANFLSGLQSISGGELVFSEVEQEVSDADLESGEGDATVRFQLNGVPHELKLAFQHDWLDCEALDQVNAILAEEKTEKRYYAAWNSMQGMTIFYCDAQWAKEFERTTGTQLFTKVT